MARSGRKRARLTHPADRFQNETRSANTIVGASPQLPSSSLYARGGAQQYPGKGHGREMLSRDISDAVVMAKSRRKVRLT